MLNLRKYIIEKLVIDKDTKIDVWDKYEEGDICLILIYIKDIANFKNMLTMNVIKIKELDKNKETILSIPWNSENLEFGPEGNGVAPNKVIEKNGYLFMDDEQNRLFTIYIPQKESRKIFEIIKKEKKFDFNSLIKEKPNPLKITMNLNNEITDDDLKKLEVAFDEIDK